MRLVGPAQNRGMVLSSQVMLLLRYFLPYRSLEEEREARRAAEREAREAWQATAAATRALEEQSAATCSLQRQVEDLEEEHRAQVSQMEERSRQRLETMQSTYQSLLRTAQEKLQQLRIKQGLISAQIEAAGGGGTGPQSAAAPRQMGVVRSGISVPMGEGSALAGAAGDAYDDVRRGAGTSGLDSVMLLHQQRYDQSRLLAGTLPLPTLPLHR